MKQERIYSIDTLRFVANFCIILTHTRVIYYAPSFDMHGALLAISYPIYYICRLALPFFFLFSGYFFTRSILKGNPVKVLFITACKRLLLVFFCYQILYALIPANEVKFLKDVTLYGWIRTYYWYFLDLNHHPVYLFF